MLSTRRSTGKTCASAQMSSGSVEASRRARRSHQVAAERVDDAVDGLVGHRLALVRAPAKDEDVAALARARRGSDARRPTCRCPTGPQTRTATGLPVARRLERVAQHVEVAVAADEQRRLAVVCDSRGGSPVAGRRAESAQDLRGRSAAPRAPARAAPCRGHPGPAGTPSTHADGGHGRDGVLECQHVDRRPGERRPPHHAPRRASRPTLYQSEAAIGRLARRLLRRHVRRPCRRPRPRSVGCASSRRSSVATPKSRMTTRPSA